jgi:hypothetical protein
MMNKKIEELAEQCGFRSNPNVYDRNQSFDIEKFAELIVQECRTVVTEVYRNTPLELCGPLLTADEKIAEHFYGVEE